MIKPSRPLAFIVTDFKTTGLSALITQPSHEYPKDKPPVSNGPTDIV
jgi:hypothetical protein